MHKWLLLNEGKSVVNLHHVCNIYRDGVHLFYEFAGNDSHVSEYFDNEEDCIKRFRSVLTLLNMVEPEEIEE